jgi:hypothetical protein
VNRDFVSAFGESGLYLYNQRLQAFGGIHNMNVDQIESLYEELRSHAKNRRIYLPNVRDHRWLPVARLVPGEERAQARGVTRVAIRWIALFDLFSFGFEGSIIRYGDDNLLCKSPRSR